MVEAEIFQEISDALENGGNHISVPIENASPIHKVVWSSFDYMAGPEMRFVWEPDYSKQNISDSAAQNQNNELASNIEDLDTVDGCVSSSDSSFSKNTGGSTTTRDKFEEIDAYNSDLLKLSSGTYTYENVEIEPNFNLQSFAQSSTTDSTVIYGDVGTSQSFVSNNKQSQQNTAPTTPLAKQNSQSQTDLGKSVTTRINAENREDELPADNMVTSCVDSGIAGTISMDSNLSSFATQEPRNEVIYKAKDDYCNIKLGKNRELSCKDINEAQEVIEFDHDTYSDRTGAEETLTNPNIPTSSQLPMMNSEIWSSFYSATADSKPNPKLSREQAILYKEAEMLATELSSAESMAIPDELFIAKHVLAEQIGSIQLTINPILHKFCIIPSRHIAFGSYIFSTRDNKGHTNNASPNLSAFSIMIPIEMTEWYLERQPVFQEILSDIIARFKAAHLVETLKDLICRCTRDFSMLLTFFGALERWPLDRKEMQRIRIQSSHLWEIRRDKIDEREFVARCITACLMCRGRCTVIGSNSKEVIRLMMTLNAFLEPKDRIISLKPHKLQYNPYLRLQAVKRSEIYQFFEHAANAHWPCSLLDIDRKSVIYTGLYQKHRAQKKMSQHFQISQVFREAVDSGLSVPLDILTALDQQLLNGPRTNILETQADIAVIDFMNQITFLPLNRAARLSFIDHFHLRMENRAKALITYVRDLSIPTPYDKRSALSSRWHLATVRRNLNLQQDSAYGIALARADSLLSDFAEFIIQHTTSVGRHLNY